MIQSFTFSKCKHVLDTFNTWLSNHTVSVFRLKGQYFYIFLTVHHSVDLFQITNLIHNSFILQQYICHIIILDMFRAVLCSSSGGQIVLLQPLVSSLSVNGRTVRRLRADCPITIYMLHYNPQHVSSSTMLIFSRTNCIITASGIVTLCKRPYGIHSTARNMSRIIM